jgi:hypothetical protein
VEVAVLGRAAAVVQNLGQVEVAVLGRAAVVQNLGQAEVAATLGQVEAAVLGRAAAEAGGDIIIIILGGSISSPLFTQFPFTHNLRK